MPLGCGELAKEKDGTNGTAGPLGTCRIEPQADILAAAHAVADAAGQVASGEDHRNSLRPTTRGVVNLMLFSLRIHTKQAQGRALDKASGAWRGEGVSDATLAVLRHHVHADLNDAIGAALICHLRYVLFFERGLDANEETLLVGYEAKGCRHFGQQAAIATNRRWDQGRVRAATRLLPDDPGFAATARGGMIGHVALIQPRVLSIGPRCA